MVLLNHSIWYRTGSTVEIVISDVATRLWMGVPIFFVISGYCISATVDAHRRRAERPLQEFFLRRLRRIFPPYWAVLGATIVVVSVLELTLPGSPLSALGKFLRPWWFSASQWVGNVTLTETWRWHLWGSNKSLFLGHAWTLCYEEQFYLVAGLLLWWCPQRFFLGALGVTVAVLLAMASASAWNLDFSGAFFDGSWLQFWFGVALYYALVIGKSPTRGLALVLFVGIAALCAREPALLWAAVKNDHQSLFVASAFAAIALILHHWDARLARSTVLKPLQICGMMCYSLYLVHLPISNFLLAFFAAAGQQPRPLTSLIVTVPLCLALSWWFHVSVERRFMSVASRTAGKSI